MRDGDLLSSSVESNEEGSMPDRSPSPVQNPFASESAVPKASFPGSPDAPPPKASGPAPSPETRSVRSQEVLEGEGGRRRRSGSARGSRGSLAADKKRDELKMSYMLGTIEVGHTKPSPIFPSTMLGHLLMRKYGLTRAQRASVIRATEGSSRFTEIERILRASDVDESTGDTRLSHHHERRGGNHAP